MKDLENARVDSVLDGGWGWIIVLSSFLIHFFMDGVIYALGTFLTPFIEEFNVTHAEASIVHSLLPALTLFSGPLASMFTNKYGCKWTTVIGASIASFGFFLSFFVTNFFYFYITIGIISGNFTCISSFSRDHSNNHNCF
jgi:MFS family permease